MAIPKESSYNHVRRSQILELSRKQLALSREEKVGVHQDVSACTPSPAAERPPPPQSGVKVALPRGTQKTEGQAWFFFGIAYAVLHTDEAMAVAPQQLRCTATGLGSLPTSSDSRCGESTRTCLPNVGLSRSSCRPGKAQASPNPKEGYPQLLFKPNEAHLLDCAEQWMT